MSKRIAAALGLLLAMAAGEAALAGKADVVAATARRGGDGLWRFEVTVRHADSGWEHYADAYEVLSPDGTLLGRRVLAHPHENEQPFTRSLSGVRVPPSVRRVHIRAHDKVHGWGGNEVIIDLPR